MAKVAPVFTIDSYGIYTQWDAKSKALPKVKNFTLKVPAELDIEFGYILNVKKGKGIKLNFLITHPGIEGGDGNVMAPFSGDIFVKDNDWDFFLGDTLWEPISDKIGDWKIQIFYQGKVIADKVFNIFYEEQPIDGFALLNKKVRTKSR